MTKFLDTTGISYHLEQLIKKSDERLILISPFLKINPRIKELLHDKNNLKIDIRVIYGKDELKPEEHNWLKSMNCIRTSFCQNLHAKCYLNEKEAIITSMNLFEFSQSNNNEMGIYVNKETDSVLYADIYSEANRLIRISNEVKSPVEKTISKNTVQVKKIKEVVGVGHCIRCHASIELDPSYPYCTSCYNIWSKYEDDEYTEKFCHICGKTEKTSKSKPTCYNCYKTNKNKLEFPLVF
ncbi:MAG TPA: phospholipase D family protein [Bacteroidia bacterium]|nr:phospholipase D family protein [Bacteroidia bacterium]